MKNIISHKDFLTVEKLSDEHLELVKRYSDYKRNSALITCLEVLLCIIIVAIVISCVKGLSRFDYIHFSVLLLFALTIGIVELICSKKIRISATAYGTVTDLICDERQVPTRCTPDILPWENDKYKKHQRTAVTSVLKYFYYINAETTQGCLQHICCKQSDYEQLSVGDKVIIIKYRNGTVMCLPAK